MVGRDSLRPLTPELKQIAVSELNEDEAKIHEELEHLRLWLRQSPHIKGREDAQFLIAFLRGCKHSLERAKEKLDNYYTSRSLTPEFYNGSRWQDDQIIQILRLNICVPFPKTISVDAPRIVLIRCASFDPKQLHVKTIMRMACMINDLLMLDDDQFTVCGLINIIDMVGASKSLAYIGQFTPQVVKSVSYATQDALPVRTKGIHFLNPPPTFDTVFGFFKGMFNKKNASRADKGLVLECHGTDLESLFNFIPKELFPSEYGGEAGTMDEIVAYWEQKLKDYRDYFKEDDRYGTIESKRARVVTQTETINTYGYQGSFRQLNVD